MIKILTQKSGRKSIENLNGYLRSQTDQNFEWIVLDDRSPKREVPYRCNKHIKPKWSYSGKSTEDKCLSRLMEETEENDFVLVCKDTEFYDKDYVKTMRAQFENKRDIIK